MAALTFKRLAFFLQQLTSVPLDFDFTLYKHGPYSFELNDELSALRGDEFLTRYVRDERYGPCYRPGTLATNLVEQFPKTLRQYETEINYVATHLGNANVGELERLGTALFLRNAHLKEEQSTIASKLSKVKPHISIVDALDAIQRIDQMILEVRSF